ncbi:MAG: enoyl-CoA hydratase [Frankiaceae bacterium]|nr:enoyl-CoA hydratase [Frankiaceae bacterium]
MRFEHGKVNALDLELLGDISDTMRDLGDAGAIVLTGAGRAFSAGVDLRRIVDGGAAYAEEFLPALSEAFLAVFDCPRPVIAAINGHALAGGCVIAAAADLRLMSGGTIGLTELLVGVQFPTVPLEIARYAFGPRAARLALTAETFDADHALRLGLVDEVVGSDELLPEAITRAEVLAGYSARVYTATKEQLHREARRRIDERRLTDDAAAREVWTADGTIARIAAFLDTLSTR